MIYKHSTQLKKKTIKKKLNKSNVNLQYRKKIKLKKK